MTQRQEMCSCPGCPEHALPDSAYCPFCEDHAYHVHCENCGKALIAQETAKCGECGGPTSRAVFEQLLACWRPCLGRRLRHAARLPHAVEDIAVEDLDIAEFILEFEGLQSRHVSWVETPNDQGLMMQPRSFYDEGQCLAVDFPNDPDYARAIGERHTRLDLYGHRDCEWEVRCARLSFETTVFSITLGNFCGGATGIDLYLLNKREFEASGIASRFDHLQSLPETRATGAAPGV